MTCTADKDNDAKPMPCPWESLRAVGIEASLILGAFGLLSLSLDRGATLSWDATVTFLTIFVPISFIMKAIDVDYSDQLARVAMFQMGVKIFNVLAG